MALSCVFNLPKTSSAYAQTGDWSDYKSSSLDLLNPLGENSPQNPYLINSAQDLALLAYNVNNGEKYFNEYFLQTADIDLEEHYFIPIGQGFREFFGIYDGNGFVIDNLYINLPFAEVCGLFGNVVTTGQGDSGILRNIHITSGTIIGNTTVGSVAGIFSGQLMENCYSGVTINQGGSSNQNIGGLTGNNTGIIDGCNFYGDIEILSGQYVGGIAGVNSGQITNSYNIGSITAINYVGGIVGENQGEISQSFNNGKIVAQNRSGGITGYNTNTVTDCYNIGFLDFYENYVGELIGEQSYNALSQNLYYDKKTGNKAIGQINNDLTGAVDDIDNNVMGLEYYEMFTQEKMVFSEQENWVFSELAQAFGYLPYPNNFDTTIKDYVKSPLFDGDSDIPTWGQSTEQPYVVSTAQHFVLISHNANNGISYADTFFVINNDIDFSQTTEFLPIGMNGTAFSGYIEGGNNSLKNLSIDSSQDYTALFANALNAQFHNIAIESFDISASDYAAMLCANDNNGIYNNIAITDSQISANDYVGSLIGKMVGAEIVECLSHSSVQGNSRVGGLVGDASGGSSVTNSYFFGTIFAENDNVGGLIGYSSADINSSFVYSTLIQGNDFVGGIVGRHSGGVISLVYARANLMGNSYVGGIGGQLSANQTEDTYFVGNIEYLNNGATIANLINSASLSSVYYNSDYFVEDTTITLNGQPKNSVELTGGISNFITNPKQGLFGYYPSIGFFEQSDTAIESIICNYFKQGDGTQSKPYEVENELQLRNIQRLISSNYFDYCDKNYSLTQDITLLQEFQPIASSIEPFIGKFNGRHYSIYNLYINKPNTDYVGLFSYIGTGSTIEKLNIRPEVISSEQVNGSVHGRNYVGAIAGYSQGFIWDCSNSENVTGNDYVGGLSGRAYNISRSFNTALISGNNYVGGITGHIEGSSVQLSFNSGYIIVNGTYGGGIAGKNSQQIDTCYNSGNIESDSIDDVYVGTYKGGIVGQNVSGASVRNSYSIGAIKGDLAMIAGGIIADNLSSDVMNVYFNNEIAVGLSAIGQGNQGGTNVLGLTTIQMVGSVALDNMIVPPNNYISNEERGMDADFAPQLILFANKTVLAGENTAIIEEIENYSKQSVMLRLFGIEINNPMEWGTQDNPYIIATFDHLDTLSKQVDNNFTFDGCYFLVTSDITILSGFQSIGKYHTVTPTESKIFNGVFDGGGFDISNLIIGYDGDVYSQGLFGYIGTSSIIRNVIISSGEIRSKDKVGSVVGYSLGEVTRCYSSATVIGDTSVGGIVGQIRTTSITHCLFDGSVVGNSNYWGGITGRLENGATVYNSWFVLDLDTPYTHKNGTESILYNDKNGTVQAGINMQAQNIEDFIYFELNANTGFGYEIRFITNNKVTFNEGGQQGNKYYPHYSKSYLGVDLIWYARYTKTVTITGIQNGYVSGAGNYYEGQRVTIYIKPDSGYRLELNTSLYSYSSNGESIDCSFTMGSTDREFSATFVAFGTSEEIQKPSGIEVQPSCFEYDGLPKNYIVDFGEYFITYTEYYTIDNSFRVEEAVAANDYKLVVKIQDGNIIVGSKEIEFSIIPKKLTLKGDVLASSEYTQKQYDKYDFNEILISNDAIDGIVVGDQIILNATRSYDDYKIGNNKAVSFHSFYITGSGASNYQVPDDVTGITGTIVQRQAWVTILEENLTREYDGEAPIIQAHNIEGKLTGDGLFVNEFEFIKISGSSIEGWTVGRYEVHLTSNIVGNEDENYDIKFITEQGENPSYYEFVITPKIITTIDFSGYQNLQYTGSNLDSEIQASYAKSANSIEQASLIFYYENQQVEHCLDAGNYIAKVNILDENFQLDSEKSISFKVSKVDYSSAIILTDISDADYSVTQIELSAEGGYPQAALSYEVVSGPAVIQQNTLIINGAGTISVRAIRAETKNYNRQFSQPVTFIIAKCVLTAIVENFSIEYGDTPIVEIVYYDEQEQQQVPKQQIKGLIEPTAYISASHLVANQEYDIYLRDNGSSDGYIIDVSQAVNAKLFVLPKRIHLLANAASKMYGSEDPELTFTILEDSSIAVIGALQRAVGENAGRYIIQQNDIMINANTNYDIVYVPNYFTIYPRELRVSIPTYIKPYGTNDPEPKIVINEEDLRLGDNSSVLRDNYVITRTEGEMVDQKYNYRYSNIYAGINYTVRFTQVGHLHIIKATPILKNLSAKTIVYGDYLGMSIINGQVEVDTKNGTQTLTGQFVWKNPYTKPSALNSNITLYGAKFIPSENEFYNIVEFDLSLVIEKRKISLAFMGTANTVYDGSNKALLNVQAYNVLEDDEVAITIRYTQNEVDKELSYSEYFESMDDFDYLDYLINAGRYFAIAHTYSDNYTIDGIFIKEIIIAPCQIDVIVEDAVIVYGEKYTPIIRYQGFKNLDNEQTLTKQAYVKNVPSSPDSYTIVAEGAEALNYSFRYLNASLVINRVSYEGEDIKIEGVLPPDLTFSVDAMTSESASFALMEDFTKTLLLNNAYKGYALKGYSSISYSEPIDTQMTYSIKMQISPDTPIIIHHHDGSVEILHDYKYEDGYITFTASGISGIATIRQQSFFEKTWIYFAFAGGAIVITFAGIFIAKLNKRIKKRREKYIPKFKD